VLSDLILILSESTLTLCVVAALVGLCVGSFLNVVIYRVPLRMHHDWKVQSTNYLNSIEEEDSDSGGDADSSKLATTANNGQTGSAPLTTDDLIENNSPPGLALPASHCTSCGTTLRSIDNIPLLSYIFLGGRCAHCGERISLRYPAIEVLCAVMTVVVALYFGFSWQMLAAAVFSWILIALSFIDIDEKLLPDDITLPGLWAGLVVNLFGVMTDLRSAVIGAIAGYLVLWFVYQLFKLTTGKEGMGFGDFKLLAMIGAWLGWQVLPLVIILSAVTGTAFGLFMIVSGRQQSGQQIPFGPYLAAGGWIALIWGDAIISRYLTFSGLG